MAVSLPRPGSSLHYTLLQIHGEARERVLYMLQLQQEMDTAFDAVQDEAVLHQKLHWWHGDIQRLNSGTCEHPRLRDWQNLNPSTDAVTVPALLDLIGAAAAQRLEPARNSATMRERDQRRHASRLMLLCRAAAPSESPPQQAIEALASPLAALERWRHLPSALARNEHCLDDAIWQGMALDSHAAALQLDEPRFQTALQQQWQQLVAELDSAAQQAMADIHWSAPTWQPLRCHLALRRSQLRLWQAHSPRLRQETITLTPLRKWFIAWRTR